MVESLDICNINSLNLMIFVVYRAGVILFR